MVRHLFNVRRVFMYHGGPQRPNYDGLSSTMTEPFVGFVTHHFLILTNHYCPSDGPTFGKDQGCQWLVSPGPEIF